MATIHFLGVWHSFRRTPGCSSSTSWTATFDALDIIRDRPSSVSSLYLWLFVLEYLVFVLLDKVQDVRPLAATLEARRGSQSFQVGLCLFILIIALFLLLSMSDLLLCGILRLPFLQAV